MCYERVRLVIASDWRVYGELLGTTVEVSTLVRNVRIKYLEFGLTLPRKELGTTGRCVR